MKKKLFLIFVLTLVIFLTGCGKENKEKIRNNFINDTENLKAAICAFCRHFYPSRIKKIDNIHELLDFPFAQDIENDKKLIRRMKAVAYAYAKASRKPCNI